MFPVILSVFLSVLAGVLLIVTTSEYRASKRVSSRLAAFDQDRFPEAHEASVDIRKKQQTLSAIPWLNRWLTSMNLATASSLFLYQAGVTLSLGTLALLSVAGSALCAYAIYFRSGESSPAILVGAISLSAPFLWIRRKRSQRLSLLEQQLPEALGMMASALRVGHSLVAGLGAAAQDSPEPIGAEIRKCFEEQNYGIDLRVSLTNLTLRVPVQDFRIFVAAVLIQRESGGNLAEVLEKVVQTARERFRLKKQVNVHTAQGRLTGWVLTLLPLVIGFAMYLLNPEGMSILWKREIGLKMLYLAGGMDVVGGLIIRKIVSIRV